MEKQPSEQEFRALAGRIRKLMQDPEWQEGLRRSLEESEKEAEDTRRAMRPRWEDLQRPFTI